MTNSVMPSQAYAHFHPFGRHKQKLPQCSVVYRQWQVSEHVTVLEYHGSADINLILASDGD